MFTHRVRVRYGEVDPQRVVFNANWLAYFDDAMTHYFGHLGFDPKQTFFEHSGFDVMLRRATVEWTGAVGFDDQVAIDVYPSRLGNSSFDLTYDAKVDGETKVTGVITYVSIVPGENRSQPIPGFVRSKLEAEARG